MARRLDPFMAGMFAAIAAGAVWPAAGGLEQALDLTCTLAVGLLFFLHGAAIAPRHAFQGLRAWRLHALIFSLTFVVFPLLVAPAAWISNLPHGLSTGFLFLAVLPSAVSSSIAYTALARGNVPAAVCAAAASNILGLLMTPILLSLLLRVSPAAGFDLLAAFKGVVFQLLAPFALGQGSRLLAGSWVERRPRALASYDQAVIVLVIYVAFSQSAGLWTTLSWRLAILALVACLALLCAVFLVAVVAARSLRLSRDDEIAAVFCGSKKSLASGLPLAQVLFAGSPEFGLIILPIIIYNQVQIIAGVFLARRYAQGALDKEDASQPQIRTALE